MFDWYAAFCPNPLDASNLRAGKNPPYLAQDFLKTFPQFKPPAVSDEQIEYYVALANALLQETRWGDLWEYAMGLCTAHFLTIALQVQAGNGTPDSAAVAAAAQSKGTIASKSVDGVSVSYQFTALDNYKDWGGWLLTAYGTQLATLGQTVGMGGMYLW